MFKIAPFSVDKIDYFINLNIFGKFVNSNYKNHEFKKYSTCK